MISDKEWLRKLGEWTDWQDENFGERELRNYMMIYDEARFLKAIAKCIREPIHLGLTISDPDNIRKFEENLQNPKISKAQKRLAKDLVKYKSKL